MKDRVRALADPPGGEILTRVGAGPLTAGQIAEKFPVSAAAVSRHLSVLKEADLVRDRREGKYIYYELNASVLEEILLWLITLKGEENDETLE